MLSVIFIVLMLMIFGKLLVIAFKATWGLTKIILTFIFLPIILIIMMIMGMFMIAIPILILVGVAALLL